MPESASGRGSRFLKRRLRFQILRVAFQITVDTAGVDRALYSLVHSARQPEAARSHVSYDVRRRAGAYEVLRETLPVDVQFDLPGVRKALATMVQRDALSAWPGAVVLQAVTARHRGERFLVVGESPSERSELALQLLRHGAEVECDGLAILDHGAITAYPQGSEALDRIRAAKDRRVTTGPVDAVVELATNLGGQTRVSVLAHHEAARVLLASCDPLGDPPAGIRAAARLADSARCYQVWLGSIEHVGAVWDRLVVGRLQ